MRHRSSNPWRRALLSPSADVAPAPRPTTAEAETSVVVPPPVPPPVPPTVTVPPCLPSWRWQV